VNVQVSKNLAQEKKTKLKINNRSRKQERLRLRNSEDPAARSSAKLLLGRAASNFCSGFRTRENEKINSRKTESGKGRRTRKKRTSCKNSRSVTRPARHEFEIGSCILMMNARFFVKRPRMGSSNYWPYQSTLQDIEEGRNTLLKELSVKDWLGHACSHWQNHRRPKKFIDNWVTNFNE